MDQIKRMKVLSEKMKEATSLLDDAFRTFAHKCEYRVVACQSGEEWFKCMNKLYIYAEYTGTTPCTFGRCPLIE